MGQGQWVEVQVREPIRPYRSLNAWHSRGRRGFCGHGLCPGFGWYCVNKSNKDLFTCVRMSEAVTAVSIITLTTTATAEGAIREKCSSRLSWY